MSTVAAPAHRASFADAVGKLGVSDPLLDEGLAELVQVVETAGELSPGLVRAWTLLVTGATTAVFFWRAYA